MLTDAIASCINDFCRRVSRIDAKMNSPQCGDAVLQALNEAVKDFARRWLDLASSGVNLKENNFDHESIEIKTIKCVRPALMSLKRMKEELGRLSDDATVEAHFILTIFIKYTPREFYATISLFFILRQDVLNDEESDNRLKLRSIHNNDFYKNRNQIFTDQFSNRAAQKMYHNKWPGEPKVKDLYSKGQQCCSCKFYREFDDDWGLCANRQSRHFRETIFEHFTCDKFIHTPHED